LTHIKALRPIEQLNLRSSHTTFGRCWAPPRPTYPRRGGCCKIPNGLASAAAIRSMSADLQSAERSWLICLSSARTNSSSSSISEPRNPWTWPSNLHSVARRRS